MGRHKKKAKLFSRPAAGGLVELQKVNGLIGFGPPASPGHLCVLGSRVDLIRLVLDPFSFFKFIN